LVVVAFEKAKFRAGTDAAGFEELEQATVPLVDAADGIGDAWGGVGKKFEAAMATTGRAFHLAEVAVGANSAFTELGEKFRFEVGRDGMFKAFSFIVNFPPLHTEKFGEHSFDEVMAEGKFAGNFSAGCGEANVAVGLDAHQSVFLEAAERHGDGWSRYFEPFREAGRDDGLAFAFSLQDGFEIVLFGDGDHLGEIIRRS